MVRFALGIESQAVVEFALNQKAPPEKKKVDSRHATIQQGKQTAIVFIVCLVFTHGYSLAR